METVSAAPVNAPSEIRTFGFYADIVKRPLLLVLVLDVVFVFAKLGEWTLWTANLLYFLLVTWVVLRRKREDFPEAGTAVILSGITIGLVVSIAKLIVHQKVYLLFNLVAEPVRLAIVGLAVAWIATLWFTRQHRVREVRRPSLRI